MTTDGVSGTAVSAFDVAFGNEREKPVLLRQRVDFVVFQEL
jgi:hypothetical protein